MRYANRREFALPKDDELHLNARGSAWETVLDSGSMWLLIHDFPIPYGYAQSVSTVAVQIPASYPTTGPDMVYFSPPLSLADGTLINAAQVTCCIQGESFQRWSRHRSSLNPWRPGLDDVSSHLSLVEEWLNVARGG